MLNAIFIVVVVLSILMAAYTGRMEALTNASFDSAKDAVKTALELIGVMAFWLGLMRVASDGGLLRIISRALGPLMRKLFPTVPPDHPAISAMVLNIGSNLLGLGNAATPFGIKAMEELDRLNGEKGTATDAMVLFLAINTSGLALLPTGVLALRASLGSHDPAGIFVTTWVASGCATLVGVVSAILLSRVYRRSAPPPARAGEPPVERFEEVAGDGGIRSSRWKTAAVGLVGVAFLVPLGLKVFRDPGLDTIREIFSYWLLPALIGALLLFGWSRGVKVYASLVEGAKEGFQVAVRIIPYLVAILVMVGMFRAAGGIEILDAAIGSWTARIGIPAEALPMALMRPLSGSGAYGILAELLKTHGPDSYIGYLASTFQGSTETTFYVLAVYFGAVRVRRTRHALPACLLADAAGILAAAGIVRLLFG